MAIRGTRTASAVNTTVLLAKKLPEIDQLKNGTNSTISEPKEAEKLNSAVRHSESSSLASLEAKSNNLSAVVLESKSIEKSNGSNNLNQAKLSVEIPKAETKQNTSEETKNSSLHKSQLEDGSKPAKNSSSISEAKKGESFLVKALLIWRLNI